MCIYNHCIEDRQKNLVFMAEMPQVSCRIITIKPLSHLAYIITASDSDSRQFSEANKVLYS